MSSSDSVRALLEAVAPVSDDQWRRLQIYAANLQHWQKTLNLVAPSTLGSLWQRHILDSWQLVPLALPRQQGALVDLGSGAGLPGLILAIAGAPDVHLVESNQRKAAFLRFAAEQTGAACTVHPLRIEALDLRSIGKVAVITARALAGLPALLALALPLCHDGTALFFSKGRRWREEVRAAEKSYSFSLTAHESVTDSEAVILELRCLTER